MLRNLSPSSLQKAYDDCYMSCSTAVYFEKEGNESEAILYWKRGLDQVNEYHATRVFSPNPRTDTEKELLKSLKELEIQCKERIDLLEALRISRAEAAGDPSSSVGKWVDATRTEKGFIGEGTIPAVSYPDLARPSPQQRPPMHSRTSSEKGVLSGSARSSLEAFRPNITYAGTPRKESRSTSPDKPQYIMRTTLRSGKTQGTGKSSRRSAATPVEGPGASKAATIAWSKEAGSRRSPIDVTTSASTPVLNEASDQTRRASGSTNVQFDSHSRRLVPPRENDPEATISRVPRGKRDPANRKSIEEYSFPGPSLLSISAASSALNNHYSADSPTAEIDFSRSSRTQKPRSAQKPSSGRISYDRLYDPSHSPDNDPSDQWSTPLDIPIRRKPVGGNSEASSRANTPSRPNISKSSSSRPERRRLSRSSPPSYDDDTPKTRKRRSLTSSSGKQKDRSLLMDSPTKSPPQTPSDEDDLTQAEAKAWKRRKQQILRKLPLGVDEHAAKQILNEIVVQGDEVHWDDIAGLTVAKAALRETVVYPFLRPDLFMGLREPARGMLLFGPPGTGKTMLARAVATESASTFFSISASSLTSKYLGESEKLVRALFALAKTLAPSIIFVDEIDSLLSQRSGSGEHEATRRIKTEFLIQWSDLQRAAAGRDVLEKDKERDNANRVLVLAATNMPWAIDEAARRRFVRRQYIPLPEPETRKVQFERLLEKQKHELSEMEIAELVEATEGFSGSDITALAKDAAMGPLRSLGEAVLTMSMDEIRPIGLEDFKASLKTIRPSVSPEGLKEYEEWARKFGERGG